MEARCLECGLVYDADLSTCPECDGGTIQVLVSFEDEDE